MSYSYKGSAQTPDVYLDLIAHYRSSWSGKEKNYLQGVVTEFISDAKFVRFGWVEADADIIRV